MVRPPSPGQADAYFPFIDGLRGIAVVAIILFHFDLFKLTGGYIGIDVLFVMSGFLIAADIDYRLRRENFSLTRFFDRRARRLLPALAVSCTLCILAALALLVPQDLREFAKSLKAAAFMYSNVEFAQSAGYLTDPFATRPLLHTWAIALQAQFYLLFPLLMLGFYRAVSKNPWRLLLAVGWVLALSLAF